MWAAYAMVKGRNSTAGAGRKGRAAGRATGGPLGAGGVLAAPKPHRQLRPMADESKDPFDLSAFSDDPGGGAGGARGSAAGGGAAGGRRRSRRRGLFFLLGLLVGLAAGLFAPPLIERYVGPTVPGFLGGGAEEVSGTVLGKRLDGERLLLTVETERGALLATFTERVPEIDLLVSTGDTVRLRLGQYEPFVTDPRIQGIRKAGPVEGRPPATARDTAAEAVDGADTLRPPPDTAPSDVPGPDTAPSGVPAPDTAPAASA